MWDLTKQLLLNLRVHFAFLAAGGLIMFGMIMYTMGIYQDIVVPAAWMGVAVVSTIVAFSLVVITFKGFLHTKVTSARVLWVVGFFGSALLVIATVLFFMDWPIFGNDLRSRGILATIPEGNRFWAGKLGLDHLLFVGVFMVSVPWGKLFGMLRPSKGNRQPREKKVKRVKQPAPTVITSPTVQPPTPASVPRFQPNVGRGGSPFDQNSHLFDDSPSH